MDFDGYSSPGARLAEALTWTLGAVRGTEFLPDVPALQRFMKEEGITQEEAFGEEDLQFVVRLRTLLRSVFTTADVTEAVTILNRILIECEAVPQLVAHDGGDLHLHVSTPRMPAVKRLGADAAMGLLAVIRSSGLTRLRTCDEGRCRAAFVDVSRNNSRRYCSAQKCANRAHAATYRAKKRAQSG